MEYLGNINTPKLQDNDIKCCEGKLTLKECWEALNSIKNNKSPGNDGFTKEFYVCFLGNLGSILVKTLNYSYDESELSSYQKQAVISLTEKKDKDKRYIRNWRPISLLNVHLKIASKALALRIKPVLKNAICHDQMAYIKDRYIGESIRLVQDIIECVDREEEEAILFSTDIEKAFDSVNHNFIFATLEKFSFGPEFIQWIKTLLKNGQSCVMNNGKSTGYFNLERGTRQGNPLPAYLFILTLEVLFLQVRSSDNIEGISINEFIIKLTAYADDAYYFMKTFNRYKVYFRYFGSLKNFPP